MNYLEAARNWAGIALPSVFWGGASCVFSTATGSRRVAAWFMHHWAKSGADMLGIRRSAHHLERLAHTRQRVLVANHQSLLDIVVIGSFLRHDYRWLAKKELFRVPFIGWHMHLTGHIPVVRGGDNRELRTKLRRAVAEGADLLFFPEGTRSPDGTLQPFRTGAFRAAVDAGLPVQPLVLRGTGGLMGKGELSFDVDHDHQCSMTVLPLVGLPAHGTTDERAVVLRDAVRVAIQTELG